MHRTRIKGYFSVISMLTKRSLDVRSGEAQLYVCAVDFKDQCDAIKEELLISFAAYIYEVAFVLFYRPPTFVKLVTGCNYYISVSPLKSVSKPLKLG